IMGVIAIALIIVAYQKGGGEHILGLKSAGNIRVWGGHYFWRRSG
ncbi:unnamed protein product, partial [marine sediment metagenome]